MSTDSPDTSALATGDQALLPQSGTVIIRDSEEARQRLAMDELGLAARWLVTKPAAFIRDLTLAGSESAEPEVREQLELHLRYWEAVQHVLTGEPVAPSTLHPAVEVAQQEAAIGSAPTTEMLASAMTPKGLLNEVVRGFSWDGAALPIQRRLLAENCRFIDGSMKSFSLQELTLVACSFLSVSIDAVARFSDITKCVLFDVDLSATSPIDRLILADAILRDVELVGLEGQQLVFDDSLVIDDLDPKASVTEQVARARSTLLSLMVDAGFEAGTSGRRQPLALRGCTFAHASFANAALRGTLFEKCVFTTADFAGASLARASFVSCTLDGVDFTVANDAHLASFDAESSAGAILQRR